jgi:DNA-binding IscR family transcriptional regulator
MKEIRDAIIKVAERVTIAELCDRSRKLQQQPLEALDFDI